MLTTQHIIHPSPAVEIIRQLFRQYVQELAEDLYFQHWEEELENPLLKYGPPKGSLVLALWNNDPAGCIALQPLHEDGVCEMKRLYVKPTYRKHGIGEVLVQQILKDAMAIGYTNMVLDTLSRLTGATRLYEKYGFINTSAYYDNPLPGVVYMEKGL